MRKVILSFIVLIALLLGLKAQESLTLIPSKDNTIYGEATNNSNAKGEHIFSGATNNMAERRALLYFDLKDTLPAGIKIDSVFLNMTVNKTESTSGTTVRVHRLQADWGEALSKAQGQEGKGMVAAPGDATWINTFFDTESWEEEGGDFEGKVTSTLSVSGTGNYQWHGKGLLDDVKLWLENDSINFGWILIGAEDVQQSAKRYSSRENPKEEERPKLIIHYTEYPVNNNPVSPEGVTMKAFPNPFIEEINIQYTVHKTESVRLEVYNLLGQQIRLLTNGIQSPGHYQYRWDGTDRNRKPAPSGMYYVILAKGGEKRVTKIMKTR